MKDKKKSFGILIMSCLSNYQPKNNNNNQTCVKHEKIICALSVANTKHQ